MPIHLKKGEREAKFLKEISGTITTHVLLEPKPLITVTDVLKSAGKTVKGTDGGSIKISAINVRGMLGVEVYFELEPPEGAALTGKQLSCSRSAEGVVLSNTNAADSPHQELTLLDDKGSFLPLISVGVNTSPGMMTEYSLTCLPQKDQGLPAKLVFSVSKGATIGVPFTLKNVPLPQARPER